MHSFASLKPTLKLIGFLAHRFYSLNVGDLNRLSVSILAMVVLSLRERHSSKKLKAETLMSGFTIHPKKTRMRSRALRCWEWLEH